MKSSFLLLAILIAATIQGFGQHQKNAAPTAAAKTSFEKAFPAAEKAKWGKEKNDYEVEFVLNGKQMAAVYDSNGALKETEEDIAISQLPAPVTIYVKQHYPKAVIKEAAKIVTPGGTITYEAEVNKKDLIFDAAGKFIHEVKDAD